MSLPFLLEIGTEEIPDWMIIPALNNLQDMFQVGNGPVEIGRRGCCGWIRQENGYGGRSVGHS